jgi:hypothetical protein
MKHGGDVPISKPFASNSTNWSSLLSKLHCEVTQCLSSDDSVDNRYW